MGRPPCSAPHRQSKLDPTATIESLREMFKSKIMNCRDHGTRGKRRRGILNVQEIDRMPSQLMRKSQRNSYDRRVRQRLFHTEVGPPITKPFNSLAFGDVKCVAICLIDFGEGLDQVSCVGFVAAQFGSDGMSINGDVQNDPVSDGNQLLAARLSLTAATARF